MKKRSQMISVRDLIRHMRTHAVASVFCAVAGATVLFGAIAFHAAGTIEVDAGSIVLDTTSVEEQVKRGQKAVRSDVSDMKQQMTQLRQSLDGINATILNSAHSVQIIDRTLTEVATVDAFTADGVKQLEQELDHLKGQVGDAYRLLAHLEEQIGHLENIPLQERDAHETRLDADVKKLHLSMKQVVEHYNTLTSDAQWVLRKLKELDIRTESFAQAMCQLEENFLMGVDEVKEMTLCLQQQGTEIEDGVVQSLTDLRMTGKQVESLHDRMTDSNEMMEGLREQMECNQALVRELQEQLAVSQAHLAELTQAVMNNGTSMELLSGQMLCLRGSVEAGIPLIEETASTIREQEARIKQEQDIVKSESAKKEQGYVVITFPFQLSKGETGIVFDFSEQLSNYGSISSKDIFVRSFQAGTHGSNEYYMGVGATIDMESATYDPVTGKLSVNHKLLEAPFGSQKGSVSFAVMGGALAEGIGGE